MPSRLDRIFYSGMKYPIDLSSCGYIRLISYAHIRPRACSKVRKREIEDEEPRGAGLIALIPSWILDRI
jgi:hypothetical protein